MTWRDLDGVIHAVDDRLLGHPVCRDGYRRGKTDAEVYALHDSFVEALKEGRYDTVTCFWCCCG